MNIGIDTRSLMDKNRTGVGEYTFGLLDALFEIDKENQYFLFYNSWKDVHERVELWQQDNVHYLRMRWPNKLLNVCLWILKWPKLDRRVRSSRQPDRQAEFGVQELDWWFSPNIHFTALSGKTKQILTIHDLSFEFFPHFYSWKRRLWHSILNPKKQCERADLILTPSENTRRDVVYKYKMREGKVKVLRPGIGRIRSSRQPGGQAEFGVRTEVEKKYNLPEKFILFLGTIEPRKNIIGLVEAYKKSKLSVDGCSLIVAGTKGWKCDDILQMIEKTEGVRYIGYINEDEKQAFYQLASLFVYPSFYEGFGFPILEASAAGTPVITSNRSSLPEVAGDQAFLIDPYNIDEIARAMKQILLENKKTDKQKVTDEFVWQQSAINFLTYIKKYESV